MQNRDEMSKNFAVVFKVIFNYFFNNLQKLSIGKKKLQEWVLLSRMKTNGPFHCDRCDIQKHLKMLYFLKDRIY